MLELWIPSFPFFFFSFFPFFLFFSGPPGSVTSTSLRYLLKVAVVVLVPDLLYLQLETRTKVDYVALLAGAKKKKKRKKEKKKKPVSHPQRVNGSNNSLMTYIDHDYDMV